MLALMLLAAAAAKPAPAPAATPAPTAKPTPATAAAPAAAPPNGDYSALKKAGEYQVRLTLRPGPPQPKQVLELLFDVSQVPEFTDATYGDRIPVAGVTFVAALDGKGGKTRYRVHPLPDAGTYGIHATVDAPGVYTLSLAPAGNEKGPKIDFQLGIGVPMPADAQGAAVGESRKPATTVDRGPAEGDDRVKKLMVELGDRWTALDPVGGKPDVAETKAVAALLGELDGKVPQAYLAGKDEFDLLAREAKRGLESYATQKPTLAAYQQTSEEQCLKCHLKYRFAVTNELARWPDVEVKPWKR